MAVFSTTEDITDNTYTWSPQNQFLKLEVSWQTDLNPHETDINERYNTDSTSPPPTMINHSNKPRFEIVK